MRTILIPLACALVTGLFVGPAAAMRVVSDDEAAAIRVAWGSKPGRWSAPRDCDNLDGPLTACCVCEQALCDVSGFCYAVNLAEYYHGYRVCHTAQSSAKGCTENRHLVTCCQWREWDNMDAHGNCVDLLGDLTYYKGVTADWGTDLPQQWKRDDVCQVGG